MTEQTEVTAQEIFDTVWQRFVVEMAPRADAGGGCFYWHPFLDARCAVGILMTREEAIEAESEGAGGGVVAVADAGRLPARLTPHLALLQDLQTAHDQGRCPGDPIHDEPIFRTREERVSLLTRIANIHGLEVPS